MSRAEPTRRAAAIVALRRAGYAGDRAAWTRLLVESRVGLTIAQHAWTAGQRVRMAEQTALRHPDSDTYRTTTEGGTIR